jgi:uncharacterized membrane protein
MKPDERIDHRLASALERWLEVGLVDATTVERIRRFELERPRRATSRLAVFAFGFGGLLLAAGVLLFVAAHWADLSPAARLGLIVAMVVVFHLGAASTAGALPALATTLHAVGTAAFGAGIFLSGQIFNLAEHWPEALLLWSVGAAFAMWMLADWPHVLWVAALVPAWLVSWWLSSVEGAEPGLWETPGVTAGLCALAVAYLGATGTGVDAVWRRALARLGAGLIIPFVFAHVLTVPYRVPSQLAQGGRGAAVLVVVWAVAILLPLAVAWFLRGRNVLPVLASILIAAVISTLDYRVTGQQLLTYLICAAGSVAIVFWGLREGQPLRVNLGVIGFALTVLNFYFGNLFTMLGRSAGLIGMGLLFIGGGWWLERLRKELVHRALGGQP